MNYKMSLKNWFVQMMVKLEKIFRFLLTTGASSILRFVKWHFSTKLNLRKRWSSFKSLKCQKFIFKKTKLNYQKSLFLTLWYYNSENFINFRTILKQELESVCKSQNRYIEVDEIHLSLFAFVWSRFHERKVKF